MRENWSGDPGRRVAVRVGATAPGNWSPWSSVGVRRSAFMGSRPSRRAATARVAADGSETAGSAHVQGAHRCGPASLPVFRASRGSPSAGAVVGPVHARGGTPPLYEGSGCPPVFTTATAGDIARGSDGRDRDRDGALSDAR